MPAARDLLDLQKRLDRFLWRGESESHRDLNMLLRSMFGKFEDVAVLGGLVRDLAREGRSGFRSDVDIVVDAPEALVASLAIKIQARRNIFGGYSYQGAKWKVDFWALETTWAVKNNFVEANRIEDVIKCTFFDWDSAMYHLWKKVLICDHNYVDLIKSRQININLEPNPAPKSNLFRALKRLIAWQLTMGFELERFINLHLTEEAYREFLLAERNAGLEHLLKKFRGARHFLDYIHQVHSTSSVRMTLPMEQQGRLPARFDYGT